MTGDKEEEGGRTRGKEGEGGREHREPLGLRRFTSNCKEHRCRAVGEAGDLLRREEMSERRRRRARQEDYELSLFLNGRGEGKDSAKEGEPDPKTRGRSTRSPSC
jgi:hypothetical protein